MVAATGFWMTRPAGQAGGTAAAGTRWLAATDAWEAGDYPAALDTLRQLMRSPEAPAYFERAALLTGELFVTTEITADGRNPALSADGQYVSYETGPTADPTTHVVRVTASGAERGAELRGGGVVFAPTDARIVWIRPRPATTAETAASRTAWDLALQGELVVRDLASGSEQVLNTGTLLKADPAWTPDGTAVMFIGAEPSDLSRSDVYATAPTAAGPFRRVTSDPGYKSGIRIGTTEPALFYQVSATPAFRDPAAAAEAGGGRGGAGRGRRGGRGGGPATWVVMDLRTTTTRPVSGLGLTMSADGSTLAWLSRDGAVTSVHRSPAVGGTPAAVYEGPERIDAPALSPDGSRLAFQMMSDVDWEIHIAGADGAVTRLTREIQHDLLPSFLTSTTLVAMMGEGRHRRSHLYDLEAGTRTRIFDNNLVRTISPEYAWVASRDGRHLAIQADRDGDTVSAERGIAVVDLTRRISVGDLLARIDRQLATETDLRQRMTAAYQPVADLARRVVAKAAVNHVFGYEKALFDFDSKHISQPGNAKAIDYLERTYRSFGYAPDVQWFEARGVRTANVLATLRGTTDPDLVYVVSSHFDSVAVGPGADDDTSGTAALLETARILRETPLPATVVFASFTGEEAGLLGSREFVRQAAAAGWNVVGALNNDMIGWGGESGRMDNTIRYSNPGIKDLQHGAAFLFTKLITYDAKYYRSTDAAAFYEAWGDIVGGIGSYPVLANPNYHQRTDYLETINHRQVMETAKTTAATLVYLASSPSRIRDLTAAATDRGVRVAWTRSPESNVREYIVAWGGPSDEPLRNRITVSRNEAALPLAGAGTRIGVKAVNAQGLEGWDWAWTVIR